MVDLDHQKQGRKTARVTGMASVSIRCEANLPVRLFAGNRSVNGIPFSVWLGRKSTRRSRGAVMVMTTELATTEKTRAVESTRQENDGAETVDAVDRWMVDSVAEIVRNLRSAPLMVHVYSKNEGHSMSLMTEKTVGEEKWNGVVRKWVARQVPVPDGLIFVRRIDDGENGGVVGEEEDDSAWGILVQGRGGDSAPLCYLLKTCGVGSESNWSAACTHFCLVRVRSFSATPPEQFRDYWLTETR